MHMQILLKFLYSCLRYWPKMHFGHKSSAITLLFLNEIIPLAIPYHSSPIPMSMQSLKKKVLKLEHRNEAQSIFDIQCRWRKIPTFYFSPWSAAFFTGRNSGKFLQVSPGNPIFSPGNTCISPWHFKILPIKLHVFSEKLCYFSLKFLWEISCFSLKF